MNITEEQSIIITFQYGKEDMNPIYDLRKQLDSILENSELGEYDGHEIATDLSDGSLYFYGPNAEILFKAIKPILEKFDFLQGAIANLRFGAIDSDALDIEVVIGK